MSTNDALLKALEDGMRDLERVRDHLPTMEARCAVDRMLRVLAASKPEPLEPSDAAKKGINCMSAWPWKTTEPEPQAQAGEPENSCLCCGHNGEPAAWVIDNHSIYVCKRCHARSNLPRPEIYATEEEGEAFTDGWFDSVEYHREAIAKKDAALTACVEAATKAVSAWEKLAATLPRNGAIEKLEWSEMNKLRSTITQANEALK